MANTNQNNPTTQAQVQTQTQTTKVIIPCRISFANIWEPKSINGSEEKYSVSCIIPKSDTKTIAKIKAAVEAAKEIGRSKKWGGKIPPNLKIVDRKVQPIIDPMECGSGDYCNVSVNFYAYNANGNRGVAAGLGNIQKIKDGERLAGKTSAAADFAEVECDEDGESIFSEDDLPDYLKV